jgi:large subunit ribosomal protein L21
MYAIVEVGGRQFKLAPEKTVRLPKLDVPVGEKVRLDRVLLVADGDKVEVGQPLLEGKAVEAEVIRHGKERKVVVFKKKRRKNYRRKKGHRQDFTEVRVLGLPSVG